MHNINGYRIIVNDYLPEDKIFYDNKNGIMYLTEINFQKLIYDINDDFTKALEIIKNHLIGRLEILADSLFKKTF